MTYKKNTKIYYAQSDIISSNGKNLSDLGFKEGYEFSSDIIINRNEQPGLGGNAHPPAFKWLLISNINNCKFYVNDVEVFSIINDNYYCLLYLEYWGGVKIEPQGVGRIGKVLLFWKNYDIGIKEIEEHNYDVKGEKKLFFKNEVIKHNLIFECSKIDRFAYFQGYVFLVFNDYIFSRIVGGIYKITKKRKNINKKIVEMNFIGVVDENLYTS